MRLALWQYLYEQLEKVTGRLRASLSAHWSAWRRQTGAATAPRASLRHSGYWRSAPRRPV